MSSRGPRPHSPALLGKALAPLQIHSQAAHHTPGEGRGTRFLSSWVAQWLCLLSHPLSPTPPLTSWKLMQRPSGQEYSGQGTLVLLGPPGAVIPSEGKGRENRPGVRTALHPPPALASIRGLASLSQPSSSLPWEQADSPSQSCSRFRHTWGAKPQGKRPPHRAAGGSLWTPGECAIEPLGLPPSLC